MASHSSVSSSRRKSRKAHFSAPSHIRRKIMSVHLAKDLRDKHHVRSLPVHKDDEVRIKRGNFKNKVGKVLTVYRKKWCIHIEKIQKEKPNGQTVQIPINTSNCELTNIKMTEFRKKLIQRKVQGQKKGKGLAPDID